MNDKSERSDRGTISRREFVVGALAAGSFLVACSPGNDEGSGSGSGASGATADAGPWSFVDDRGVEATAPGTPVKIVAGADAAAALWDWGVHPIGVFAPARLDKVQQLDNVDLSQVESLGEIYGEINLEKLAALDPDLLVAIWYGLTIPGDEVDTDPLMYGMKNQAQQTTIESLVPSVAINASVTSDVAIERFAELATSLGADPQDPAIEAERTRYEEASGALADASADKPLKVLIAYPDIDQLYVLRPSSLADMAYIDTLGVDLIDPEGDDPWVNAVSWENADKYAADVIVIDATALQHGNEGYAGLPTWNQLPAVQAGQTTSWVTPAPFSYRATADVLEKLQETLDRSEPVT